MDKIAKEIEQMAENLSKSTETPKDKLFEVIKSLGKDGLRSRLSSLTVEDKIILKAALEEMSLKKGGEGSGQAGHTTLHSGPVPGHRNSHLEVTHHAPSNTYHVYHSDSEGSETEHKLKHDKEGNLHQKGNEGMHPEVEEHVAGLVNSHQGKMKAEGKVKKAVSFDKEAQSVHHVQGNVMDTIIQEDKVDDDVDETLVKPEAAVVHHQGTPTPGWEGQVIKALEIPDAEFETMVAPFAALITELPDDFAKAYEGFDKLKNKLSSEKGVSDPAGMAAAIGRKKYGKGQFQHAAAEGKKMKKAEEFWNEVLKTDELLSDVVEKMMDKCGDSGMVMDKLAKKGADKKKVQGAVDKYKMKKADPKEKLIQMEQKEHGTKDPKKLLEAEKREKMKKAITELVSKAIDKILAEESQLGDVPDLEVGGQNRSGVKKEKVPAIENGPANKQAQNAVNDLSQGKVQKAIDADKSKKEKEEREQEPNDAKEPKVEGKKMKKSVSWEGDDRLLKTHTLGRNFNFNVENFVNETLKGAEGQTGEIKKSDTKKEDLNDLIEKSQDKTWGDLDHERQMKENAAKINGKVVKSFNETDVATILGYSEEEAKKILG